VTPSKDPILMLGWVKPGTHINAVGACAPNAQELESILVARSHLYTDYRESLFNEPGDFLNPQKEGLITEDHVIGELGELLIGKVKGRVADNDITLFKSLGLAIEDLAAGYFVYEKALESNTGIQVDL
jgi:ornithine cyclodeaminase